MKDVVCAIEEPGVEITCIFVSQTAIELCKLHLTIKCNLSHLQDSYSLLKIPHFVTSISQMIIISLP